MIVNHKNCLVNLSNSILKAFGVKPFHSTIKDFDDLLENKDKVVVMLFDGMGTNIIHNHLSEKSFIRKHFFRKISSTTPPTTAAATTAFLTGKFPIETGWLGWATYFPEYKRNVVMFKGEDYNTGEKIREENPRDVALEKFPITSIFDLISKKSSAKTFDLKKYPICEDGPKSLRHGRKQLYTILHSVDKCFTYFYWDNPDFTMHATGINSIRTHLAVRKIDRFVKRVVRDNPDTLFLTIADHGHVNTKYIDTCEHPDFHSLLSQPSTLEKRCTSFFVKKENHENFEKLFNLYYSKFFDLMTKEDVIKKKFFGEGIPATGALETIGDYIALAKDDYAFISTKDFKKPEFFKGHHAGGTIEEMEIDVSVFNR